MENDKESDKESGMESDKDSDKGMRDKGWFLAEPVRVYPGVPATNLVVQAVFLV